MNERDDFIPTRKSLLSRLRNLDDQESWRVFFETYWRLIYQTAIRAGLTEAEAEDVVQDTVISISRNIGGFHYDPAKGSFKTYLLKMTNWRITGQFRKRIPVRNPAPPNDSATATDALDRFAAPVPSALETLWDQEWEKNLFEAAVQRAKTKTDPKLYQAFDLYVRQHWPVAKVAQDLRVTRAKVYMAKHLVGRVIKREVDRLRTQPI
jgi:RNA polymerase sigma-70 factor (ECF subfamily)